MKCRYVNSTFDPQRLQRVTEVVQQLRARCFLAVQQERVASSIRRNLATMDLATITGVHRVP